MPRPTSKDDLLTAIEKERGALETLLETLPDEQMTDPGVVGDWSVKDVLAHLVEWEQMVLGWHATGLRGDRPLDEVLEQFGTSHQEILGVIQELSNKELFTAGQFAWTKKNTLGTYMVSATSSHYLWARKEIRKGFKAKQG